MFVNTITFLISLIFIYSLGNLYLLRITYINRENVEIVIGLLNQFISQNYYSPEAISKEFNTILVQPQHDYCIKSDTYKYFHQDIVMNDTYTFREYQGVVKNALQKYFFDVLPNLNLYRKNKDKPHQFKLPLKLTLPFTYYDQLVQNFKVGQQSLCLFQNYNHLPQRASLSHKNRLMTNQMNYLRILYQNHADADCIKNATYLPKTYRLFNEQECQKFFNYINSEEYEEKIRTEGPQFIVKMGKEVHRGRGIKMLFPQEREELNKKFDKGELCGSVKTFKVAQQYIGNPLLYKGHKIEFRVYWILASTNPIIAYAYDKTLIRRCIFPFDKFSLQKGAHVCNTAIVKSTLKKMQNEDDDDDDNDNDSDENNDDDDNNDEMNSQEDSLFIDWKLDHLQEILLREGRIKNKNWLQQELLPQVDRMIIHAIRSTQHTFAKDSKLGEFFAADFLLSDELDLYIMEINYNPQTLNTTESRREQHFKMVQDMVEISNAYLRSRFIRFQKIIRRLVQELEQKKQKQKDLITNQIGQEIHRAYFDRLESGISISSNNLFRLLMDENLDGTRIYKDLLQERCLF
ncbi:unnamed protein product [Paramecium sonneborni]|uniref:Tubulin-tyrosine ligase family protein n=1 Tax=Paramecium sonneborni TaxID=65129 RepID=A0A8S1NGZ1_9CILI|nr:unnamed protein product [Paramecium sonneborni]